MTMTQPRSILTPEGVSADFDPKMSVAWSPVGDSLVTEGVKMMPVAPIAYSSVEK